jgi:hypothetical protein
VLLLCCTTRVAGYSGEDNQADSVVTGLRTGAGLLTLLTTLGSSPLQKRFTPKPRNDLQCLDNLAVAMDYMIESEKIKLVGIGVRNARVAFAPMYTDNQTSTKTGSGRT